MGSKNMDILESKEPKKDISDAIENVLKHAGEMGIYQRLLFLALLPLGFAWAFAYFGHLFLTATPQEHWCYVPELAQLSQELRRNLSIPYNGKDWDRCRVYQADWSTVLDSLTPPSPNTPTVKCQHGWEFLFNDIPYATVVSDREWVCDNANLVPWTQTVAYIGSAFGVLLWGRVADVFGRLPTLIATNLVGVVGGVATPFTSGFWDFCVCRFLVGMSAETCFMMLFIILMEYVGIKHRIWVANISLALFFGGGGIALPFLALWVGNWKTLSWVMVLPMTLVLVAPFTVPESARWYASKNKPDKAVKMFKRLERINRTHIPKEDIEEFMTIANSTKEPNSGFKILFTNPLIRRILILLICPMMCIAIVFDIIVRVSQSLGGNFFITFALSSATTLPSTVVLVPLLDRFGRRMLSFWPILIVSILLFATAIVPQGVPSVTLAIIARFFNNMTNQVVILWIGEILPTPLRASGASFVGVSSYGAIVLAPFVVYAERIWRPLPLLVAAVLALVGGCLTLLLPETMGRPIPQTIADGEKLARTQWLFRRKQEAEDTNIDLNKTSTDNIESR